MAVHFSGSSARKLKLKAELRGTPMATVACCSLKTACSASARPFKLFTTRVSKRDVLESLMAAPLLFIAPANAQGTNDAYAQQRAAGGPALFDVAAVITSSLLAQAKDEVREAAKSFVETAFNEAEFGRKRIDNAILEGEVGGGKTPDAVTAAIKTEHNRLDGYWDSVFNKLDEKYGIIEAALTSQSAKEVEELKEYYSYVKNLLKNYQKNVSDCFATMSRSYEKSYPRPPREYTKAYTTCLQQWEGKTMMDLTTVLFLK